MPATTASAWRSSRHRSSRRWLAAEAAGAYRGTIADDSGPGRAADDSDPLARCSLGLAQAVDDLVTIAIDELDGEAIRDQLSVIEEARRRLDARSCRLAAALTERQQRRAREARPDDPHAGRQAEHQTRRELQDQLDWTPSQAKRAQELGREITHSPTAGQAFDEGSLPPSHAKLLADTLRWLEGDTHERVEAQLLEAAQQENASTFGRTCRRLLAEVDHDAAMQAEQRRHRRRRGNLVQTEDGMTRLFTEVAGLDGEYVATAVNAFRRFDAEGEQRTPEQATADAVVDMVRAALDAGTASRQHGARPHVLVVSSRDVVAGRRAGVVETSFSGPLPAGEGLRILDDAEVSQLLCDTRGIPVEASVKVRNVPVGVYRGVVARDGGRCIGDGCDVPAGWCDVMHLDVPYTLGGRLRIDTAGLGCTFHHNRLDHGGWTVTWIDGRPIVHHPERPPDADGAAVVTNRPPERRQPPPNEPDTPPLGGNQRPPDESDAPPPMGSQRPHNEPDAPPPVVNQRPPDEPEAPPPRRSQPRAAEANPNSPEADPPPPDPSQLDLSLPAEP